MEATTDHVYQAWADSSRALRERLRSRKKSHFGSAAALSRGFNADLLTVIHLDGRWYVFNSKLGAIWLEPVASFLEKLVSPAAHAMK